MTNWRLVSHQPGKLFHSSDLLQSLILINSSNITIAEIKEQNNNEKKSLGGPKEEPSDSTEPLVKTSNNSAEKLKRGLTNFMNQMNPAPFFIPILPQQHNNNANGAQSLSKPVAIVNEDATAEALIKRPNRLGQTRPFGPMRFG